MMDRDDRNLRHPTLGPATDLHSLRVSPDGTKIACAYTCYERAGILLVDVPPLGSKPEADASKARKMCELVRRPAVMAHNVSWFTTGTAEPALGEPAFQRCQLCARRRHGPLLFKSGRGMFRLYTVPVEGGELKSIDGMQGIWPMESDWSPK